MRLARTWILVIAGVAGFSLQASTAARYYKLGLKAEESGSIAKAYLYYTQAAAADPKRALYRQRAEALAPMAAIEAKVKPPGFDEASGASITESKRPVDFDSVFDSLTARDLANQKQLLPAPSLNLKPGRDSYDLSGDFKALFEQAAARLGLEVIFDSDYQPGKSIRVPLTGASARELLHALEAATNSFAVPLSPKLFLVAQDSEAKRHDLEQVETVTVPVPSVLTIQELTEIGQVLKQTLGIEKLFWDGQANQIIIRDRVSRVLAARSVLNDLVSYRAEVAIELEFLELDDTKSLELAIEPPTSFPITFLGAAATGNASTLTSAATIAQLVHLASTHLFGIGVANVNIIATLTQAGAKTLLKTSVASVDGQKATFHAGTKYPIITSRFVGSGSTTSGQVYSPTPAFTFEDLGIIVNATPHIHGTDDTSLDLDTEFKVLGADTGNGIPIISSRKAATTIRLKNDQWALIAGLAQESKTRSVNGPSFLWRIPLIGRLFSDRQFNRQSDYVIIALRPRLISLPPSEHATHTVYVGSEARTVTPL